MSVVAVWNGRKGFRTRMTGHPTTRRPVGLRVAGSQALVALVLVWAGVNTDYWWTATVGLVIGGWLLAAIAVALLLSRALHRRDQPLPPPVDITRTAALSRTEHRT